MGYKQQVVWVFNRTGERFIAGAFTGRRSAEEWIVAERPVGILTKYVLNKPDNPDFPEHYHFEYDEDYEMLEERLAKSE